MKILHILDHSIPLHSGSTFRTRAILEQQRKLGWETFHVTSAKQQTAAQVETVDGLTFYRSAMPQGWSAGLPVINQWAVVQTWRSGWMNSFRNSSRYPSCPFAGFERPGGI